MQALSKHRKCSGEQNAKLPYKSNLWVITKTTVLRKNIQQFWEVHFVLYLHILRIFSVLYASDKIWRYKMLFLAVSEKRKTQNNTQNPLSSKNPDQNKTKNKTRFWAHMYNVLLPRFPHTDDVCHFRIQQPWYQKHYSLKTQTPNLSRLTGEIHAISGENCWLCPTDNVVNHLIGCCSTSCRPGTFFANTR